MLAAIEPVEAALTAAALEDSGTWARFAALATIFVVSFTVGLMSLVYFNEMIAKRRRRTAFTASALRRSQRRGAAAVALAGAVALADDCGRIGCTTSPRARDRQSAASGAIDLALVLVIGFGLHNATEVLHRQPVLGTSERPSWASSAFYRRVTILPWIRRRDSGPTRRPPRVIDAGPGRSDAASDAARHRYDLEVHGMTRQNLFSDAWDGDDEEARTRHRIFWRPDDAKMGATLYELAPNAPDPRLHMHFGAEEMFFVLSGRPVFRNQDGEEELAPGDFVFCPDGRAGLHAFSNPTEEPARILAISAGSFPDVVAYPEDGYAWVATRNPDPELLARGGDPGIIARFDIPIE